MGRRRRKLIRPVRRTLPKIFVCPNCGMTSVRVFTGEASTTTISCGNCNLTYNTKTNKAPIDMYNEFVDKFMAGFVSV